MNGPGETAGGSAPLTKIVARTPARSSHKNLQNQRTCIFCFVSLHSNP